ncbi:cation transporter [Pseudoxanthomonas sangjuensis]|uniref:cation transporter n=1 Tax=Pseudoxanthomonas sangjuensis TaxID=1503750 RepID=UPI0013908218|nr:cation transporter [Pseudoxanthomonas sangjuensis]KAF1711037.1 cation transporter [Pseudoxanthomonas sangjuensis]
MSDCCGHCQADVQRMQAKQKRVLLVVLFINLATFAMMVAAAWHSRSSSLLSGSLDNLGDAATYALSFLVVGAGLKAKARVALLKAALILAAALAVAAQIVWRLLEPATPLFETMGIVGALNLAANAFCLWLLRPYRDGDINLASAYECSRNDIREGLAVIAAGIGVWLFGAGWPDLLVAAALLVMFLRSAWRVFGAALRALKETPVAPPA